MTCEAHLLDCTVYVSGVRAVKRIVASLIVGVLGSTGAVASALPLGAAEVASEPAAGSEQPAPRSQLDLPLASRAADLRITWTYASDVKVVPGALVDGDPRSIQDEALNSSFVAQVTRDGRPIEGARVTWSVSDPSARVQTPFSSTDAQGLVRAWMVGGTRKTQKIRVGLVDHPEVSVAYTLQRTNQSAKTEGRYVMAYLDAPEEARVDRVWVRATPLTAPKRTYYQLASLWFADGEFALYGGPQALPCPDASGFTLRGLCDRKRGQLRGHVALFSMWDHPSLGRPIAVDIPTTTQCRRFDHEGDGLQCMATLNWRIGQAVDWRIETVSGNSGTSVLVRASASVDRGITWQVLGTFDLPASVGWNSVSMFNENWGGAPASTCQKVALRSVRIDRVLFGSGQEWQSPVSGIAGVDLYPGALPCQNYSVTNDPAGGIRITSGGNRSWVDLKEVARYSPDDVPLGTGFVDDGHVKHQWQRLHVSRLGQ